MSKRLSQLQIDLICSLREQGETYVSISKQVECSKGAVQGVCLRNGVHFQKQWGRRATPDTPVIHKGKKRTIRRFTLREDKFITHQSTKGTPIYQIAKQLDRAPASVRRRLETLAIHEELALV